MTDILISTVNATDLPSLATKESYFISNNILHKQIDRLANS